MLFFFWTKAFLLALCIIYSNKIYDAEYLVFGDRRKVTLPSAGVAILANQSWSYLLQQTLNGKGRKS